jgi:putative NIF3 family GTP cyclohydrolase 1 type 2
VAEVQDFGKVVNETLKGIAVFEMHVNDDAHLTSSNYARLSGALINTSAKFFFTRSENEQIIAHLGPECKVVGETVTDVTDFVEGHKFGHFHKFAWKEWEDIVARQNLTILFVQGNIGQKEKQLLATLSREFCGKTLFGWAPIGHSFKILAQLLHGDQSRQFIAAVKTDGCRYFHRGEIEEESVRYFLSNVENGQGKCVQGLLDTRPKPTPTPEEIPEVNFTPWVIGLIFVGMAIVVVLSRGRLRFAPRAPGAVQAFKMQ